MIKPPTMFNTLDFFVVALAAGALIGVWHKGSIFSTARAYAQAIQDVALHDSVKGRQRELINCHFCNSSLAAVSRHRTLGRNLVRRCLPMNFEQMRFFVGQVVAGRAIRGNSRCLFFVRRYL